MGDIKNSFAARAEARKKSQLNIEAGLVGSPATSKLVKIEIAKLKSNPDNKYIYGEELTEDLDFSVASSGVIEPIIVLKMPDGTYEISSGHRRVRAATKKGDKTIDAIVHDFVDRANATMMLTGCNVHRANTPIRYARAIEIYFRDVFNISKEDIYDKAPYGADKQCYDNLGISRHSYWRIKKLVQLTLDLQNFIDKYNLYTWFADEDVYKFTEEQQTVLLEKLLPSVSEDGNVNITRTDFSRMCAEISGREAKKQEKKESVSVVIKEDEGEVEESDKEIPDIEDLPEKAPEESPEEASADSEKGKKCEFDLYTKKIEAALKGIRLTPADMTAEEKQMAIKHLEELEEVIQSVKESLQ